MLIGVATDALLAITLGILLVFGSRVAVEGFFFTALDETVCGVATGAGNIFAMDCDKLGGMSVAPAGELETVHIADDVVGGDVAFRLAALPPS